jgi:hypothetical protein
MKTIFNFRIIEMSDSSQYNVGHHKKSAEAQELHFKAVGKYNHSNIYFS